MATYHDIESDPNPNREYLDLDDDERVEDQHGEHYMNELVLAYIFTKLYNGSNFKDLMNDVLNNSEGFAHVPFWPTIKNYDEFIYAYGAGADIHKKTTNGKCTSLMYACHISAPLKMIDFLINGGGVEDGVNVNAKANNGKTVLMFSTDDKIIKMLLSHGAYVNATDNDGYNALDWIDTYFIDELIPEKTALRCVDVLLSYGIKILDTESLSPTIYNHIKSLQMMELRKKMPDKNLALQVYKNLFSKKKIKKSHLLY